MAVAIPSPEPRLSAFSGSFGPPSRMVRHAPFGIRASRVVRLGMTRVLKLALLYLSKAVGLFRLARWLTRSKLRILGYHGF